MSTTHNNDGLINTSRLSNAENFSLSADPKQAMQDMMMTIDALRSVYVAETTALQSSDTDAFLNLQDEKIIAAQRYHNGLSDFLNRKDEILSVHPDLKSMIRRKQEEFSAVARDNLDALDRMRRTVDRMGSRIMQAARDTATRDSVSYGNKGSMTGYNNKPITMGLNESA